MDNSQEVFSGKSFDDLMKTIYNNSTQKNQKLDQLANALVDLTKREGAEKEEILYIYPLVKNMIDSSIKNDETLLKLATIFQRIKVAELREQGGDGDMLSEETIARLKEEATEMANRMKASAGIMGSDAEDIQSMLDSLDSDDGSTQ